MQAVTRILTQISRMSKQEQHDMLLDMKPILEHNYRLFNDPAFIRKEWNHLLTQLKSISGYYKYEPPYTLNWKNGQAIPIVLQDA